MEVSSPREMVLEKQSKEYDSVDMILKKNLLKCWLSEKWGVCEEGDTSHPGDAQVLNYIASHFSTGEYYFVECIDSRCCENPNSFGGAQISCIMANSYTLYIAHMPQYQVMATTCISEIILPFYFQVGSTQATGDWCV